jgi:hypothetical protein
MARHHSTIVAAVIFQLDKSADANHADRNRRSTLRNAAVAVGGVLWSNRRRP